MATAALDAFVVARENGDVIELDRDPEIDPNLAHGAAQVDEGTGGILARIAHDNEVAASQHHLVEAEIFEMTAIGKINIRVCLIR